MLVLLTALQPAPHPPCLHKEVQILSSSQCKAGTRDCRPFYPVPYANGMGHSLFLKPNFCSRSGSLSRTLCLHSPTSSMSNFYSVCFIQHLILILESDITCIASHRVLAVEYISESDSPYIVCNSSSGAKSFQFNTQQMCLQSWSCFEKHLQSIYFQIWLADKCVLA